MKGNLGGIEVEATVEPFSSSLTVPHFTSMQLPHLHAHAHLPSFGVLPRLDNISRMKTMEGVPKWGKGHGWQQVPPITTPSSTDGIPLRGFSQDRIPGCLTSLG